MIPYRCAAEVNVEVSETAFYTHQTVSTQREREREREREKEGKYKGD